MEQTATISNSSSFEDLTKDNEVENMQKDEGFMDILGNNQLTKKVISLSLLLLNCQASNSLIALIAL
jgi:hypothetical protein